MLNPYKILVGRPEGKKTLRRPRRRWEYNIKINLNEIECGSMDWICVTQNRVEHVTTL